LTAYKKIEAYAASGGKVIAIEKTSSLAPGLIEQKTSAEIAALSREIFLRDHHTGVLLESLNHLADALHHALPSDVDATGKTEGLGFIHRKISDGDLYFVANTSNQPIEGEIKFRSIHRSIESWDPDSGRVLFRSDYKEKSGLPVVLAPYESRVFILMDEVEASPTGKRESAQPKTNKTYRRIADLSVNWQLHFSDNTAPQTLAHLMSWTEIEERKYYSGEAVYSRTFSLDHVIAADTRIVLDFGEGIATTDNRPPSAPGTRALLDPPIREAAVIYVNGLRAGSLWHPPYKMAIDRLLHPGENRIEVHVYNTAINEMAGQSRLDYTALNAYYEKRFDPQDMENLQPVPSGILGPIYLEEESFK
jgi:hypothetical protein